MSRPDEPSRLQVSPFFESWKLRKFTLELGGVAVSQRDVERTRSGARIRWGERAAGASVDLFVEQLELGFPAGASTPAEVNIFGVRAAADGVYPMPISDGLVGLLDYGIGVSQTVGQDRIAGMKFWFNYTELDIRAGAGLELGGVDLTAGYRGDATLFGRLENSAYVRDEYLSAGYARARFQPESGGVFVSVEGVLGEFDGFTVLGGVSF